MIIPISEELRIRGTERAWQLEKRRIRQNKHEWEAFKYFQSAGAAVSEACRRDIRLHPATTLTEAIEAVDLIAARYNKLLDDALESRRAA